MFKGQQLRHAAPYLGELDDDMAEIQGEYAGIAPAYDVLPMRYNSIGGGVDSALTPVEPKVGTIGAQPDVWARAMEAAELFWLAVAEEGLAVPTSEEMKQLAGENLAVAKAFVAPLLPSQAAARKSARPR